MVAADIRHLFRCADTDANADAKANSNPNTAKHDPCNDIDAYLDDGFDSYTDSCTDFNAGADINSVTNANACIHVDADRDSYANEYAYDYTDIDDTGTGRSHPDRPASSERSDSELEGRCRRNPLRTMVVDH